MFQTQYSAFEFTASVFMDDL